MKKFLIFTTWSGWEIEEWRNNGIAAEAVFWNASRVLRGIRRYWIRYDLPLQQIWYGNWKGKAMNADVIIVHVTQLSISLFRYINHVNPHARVIAWYWDRIDNVVTPDPGKLKGNFELWSFDPEDCIKYQMHFNHQYYFKSLVLPKREDVWDVYYCGRDSGRSKKILNVYNDFLVLGLRLKFQIVNPQGDELPIDICTDFIDYGEIRENIASTKAILEIVKEGQAGVTLRTMEALFFQKKLITDNPFVKQEKFYNANNIFVLGEDNDIKDFFAREFEPYDTKLLDMYDVKQWIMNFL